MNFKKKMVNIRLIVSLMIKHSGGVMLLTLVSHCCSFSFLSLASALCFSSRRCLASVAASMSFSFRFNVTSLHNLHRCQNVGKVRPCWLLCSANWKLDFSPSGFVIELVFQLSDFLFDDAYSFSVYEHCVLLKTHYFLLKLPKSVE